MLVHHATLSPLTAIEHSRCGSAWPAKMAPSPAAANKGHPAADVERMHFAWCKSMQMQLALWIGPYGQAGDCDMKEQTS